MCTLRRDPLTGYILGSIFGKKFGLTLWRGRVALWRGRVVKNSRVAQDPVPSYTDGTRTRMTRRSAGRTRLPM